MALTFKWRLNARFTSLAARTQKLIAILLAIRLIVDYAEDITVRPGLLSVTESVALPP